MKCECDNKGILRVGMASWYDKKKELPFVEHEKGRCKCKNDLKPYLRKGKRIILCSICCLSTDEELKP